MSQDGDEAADARLDELMRKVGARTEGEPLSYPQQFAEPVSAPYRLAETHIDRECQLLGHEFAYEPDEEPGECPPHCVHCGAEDPDYPWHALDALRVAP